MVIFVCRCHSEHSQGARIGLDGPTEWELACEVNAGIADCLGKSNMWAHRLEGSLSERLNTINIVSHLLPTKTIAIEVHFNQYKDPDRDGFFIMVEHGDKQGRILADYVRKEIQNLRGVNMDHGINVADRNRQWIGTKWEYKNRRQGFVTATKCSAILIEACYLSNPEESDWIKHRKNRTNLGWVIGLGITQYVNSREGGGLP